MAGEEGTSLLPPESLVETLRRLSEAAGVSGAEDEVRRAIVEQVRARLRPGDLLETDTMGNVVVIKRAQAPSAGGGEPGPAPLVMLAAHMDEVGLLVSSVEPDGTLRFKKVGGIDDRVLPGRQVHIGLKRVPGVIGARPIHLQKPEERRRVEDASNLVIDIGADSREQAERAVKVGDWAVFATPFVRMTPRRVRGKALDDRVGCTVLLGVLERAYPVDVAAVFTVQEEVGTRGAAISAYRVAPDLALVLEGTTCADIPASEPHQEATRLGEGAALSVMDHTSIAHPALVEQLVAVAERQGIPYQWRRTTAGGNDAGPIHVSRWGVPSASVSVPCRYIHGPAAVADLGDLQAAIRLVSAFLEQLPHNAPLASVWQNGHEQRMRERAWLRDFSRRG
ncbi:M42 family metallopeptidase [Carboxydochorda subterranea]|uniref:M42 family metallopeptidase n=1 Tax=Carboxydichorda subterranea TaxID=3109565 RepID=A0ABZ1BV40_9FIRM|nr:M42 family metallopeptidase [Limnochorda sp. L945t]WRP16458.1 M42 family metallopeptidase [Limnochorda sp. L945t]